MTFEIENILEDLFAASSTKDNRFITDVQIKKIKNYIVVKEKQNEELTKSNSDLLEQIESLNKSVDNINIEVQKLQYDNNSLNEYIEDLMYQEKDLGGELELWQIENAELKKKLKILENYFTANLPDGNKTFNTLMGENK